MSQHFTIKQLLTTTAIVAALVINIRVCGLIPAIGIASAVCSVAASRIVKRRPLRELLLGIAVIGVFFSAVDRTVMFSSCQRCSRYTYYDIYSVFGWKVATAKGFTGGDTLSRIAEKLGKPCVHRCIELKLYREFGLLIRIEITAGTLGLAEKYAYDESFWLRVSRLRDVNPDIANEFYERVLIEHDTSYLNKFLVNLQYDTSRSSTESHD